MALREAAFYQIHDPKEKSVKCLLCCHECVIKPGRSGICGVRKNIDGKLYTLVYGKLCSAAVDPIEKKPLYHFLPGSLSFSIATHGCNLRCLFCQNHTVSHPDGSPWKKLPFTPPEAVADAASEESCKTIACTYTEPTVFMEYAIDTAKAARERGIRTILVTNGYFSKKIIPEIAANFSAANIDLKGFSVEKHKKITGADPRHVMDSIASLKEHGVWIEVTTLIVPGLNETDEDLSSIANFIASVDKDIPWHVSRFHPAWKYTHHPPTPAERLEAAVNAGRAAGIRYIYIGNAYEMHSSDTICPQCGKVLIKRAAGFYVEFNLIENNRCPSCGANIAGVWR